MATSVIHLLKDAVATGLAGSAARRLRALDPDLLRAEPDAHAAACLLAGLWLDPAVGRRWSTDGGDGAAELVASVRECDRALLEGRSTDCLTLVEQSLPVAARLARAERLAGVVAGRLALSALESIRAAARIGGGELAHDDPELPELARRAQERGRVAHLRVLGEWAFLAHVRGATGLADELVAKGLGLLVGADEESVRLCAGRLLVVAALRGSERADRRDAPIRAVDRLRPLVPLYRRLRWDVELVPVLLAIHVAALRLGDVEDARAALAEADLLLRRCPDVLLLDEARSRITPTGEARSRTLDGGGLSRREAEVARLLVAGHSYREVAARLGLSTHTVGDHARSVYRKLGVRSRHGVARALQVAGRPAYRG